MAVDKPWGKSPPSEMPAQAATVRRGRPMRSGGDQVGQLCPRVQGFAHPTPEEGIARLL